MLAYLFWHRPHHDDAPEAYDRTIAAFHQALAEHPMPGFVASWSVRLEGPSWFEPDRPVLLDAYLVDDWPAIGALNNAAVRGARQAPHDLAAALSGAGTGGIAALVSGSGRGAPGHLVFAAKPSGASYADFVPELTRSIDGSAGSCWQRQLTLGPGPEFLVTGANAGAIVGVPGVVHRASAVAVWG
jgi:hypothetical protein